MTDSCVTQTNSWLPLITPIIAFITGFVTSIFAEPIRRRIFRPKVELTFNNDSDHVSVTPDYSEGKEHNAYYIRVGVVNNSSRLAKQCRAYLINVEEKVNSVYERTAYADSIQLSWSCRIFGAELEPIDLPHGVIQYVDLIATNSDNNSYWPQIRPFPKRYKEIFENNKKSLRFTVQVSGEEMDPELIKIIFVWKGKWDIFDVYCEI